MALALLLAATSARAEESRVLPEITSTTSVPIDARVLREHLRIELASSARMPTSVVLQRAGESVRFTLTFSGEGPTERDVDLGDVAEGERERVLSLAIAEAVRTPGAPPATPPRARTAPPPPAATPRPRASTATPAWRLGYEATMGLRAYAARQLAWEPRALLSIRHRGGARADLGGYYAYARHGDVLGNVSLHAVGLSLGASFDTPLGRGSRWAGRLGPRLDVGGAFGSGSTVGVATAGSLVTPTATLVLEASVRVRLARAFAAVLAVDGGGVVRGVDLQADERSVLAMRGSTFAVRLGLSAP